MRWTTFSGVAPQGSSRIRVTFLQRRSACTSARWRSIRGPPRHRAWLAGALAGRVLDYMSDSAGADMARAEALVGQALAASPRSAIVHFAKGEILRAQRRFEEAVP